MFFQFENNIRSMSFLLYSNMPFEQGQDINEVMEPNRGVYTAFAPSSRLRSNRLIYQMETSI